MSEEPRNKRISPARRVAFAGIITALSLVLLYLAYMFPYARITVLFVLSLMPIMLAYERRYADAALSFAASALLAGLLFPSDVWLLYTAFFGWYGTFREFACLKLKSAVRWVVLAALFNTAFFLVYFLASQIFVPFRKIPSVLLFLIAEAAFVVFELFYGRCRAYYAARVRKLIFRSF